MNLGPCARKGLVVMDFEVTGSGDGFYDGSANEVENVGATAGHLEVRVGGVNGTDKLPVAADLDVV